MAYLLDANVFIEARKRYYGLDFCPAFWEWIDLQNEAGRVVSIDRVLTEISAGDDDLVDWAEARSASLFLPPDEQMVRSFGPVAEWVNGRSYTAAAVSTFSEVADFYLVARALGRSDTVVTHERPRPEARSIVKIPDVCIGLGISLMNPFEMLRRERARFVLDRTR